ncbi:hypothetical protein GCM10009733_062940 [Nonomuraea maheshkhaliensis]|uniref:Uncharacterized protein n=1 Tax=Nonomuraea maheshkhaliensis TaxID=419590 RepID=A0ABN2FRF2_9ACTN
MSGRIADLGRADKAVRVRNSLGSVDVIPGMWAVIPSDGGKQAGEWQGTRSWRAGGQGRRDGSGRQTKWCHPWSVADVSDE